MARRQLPFSHLAVLPFCLLCKTKVINGDYQEIVFCKIVQPPEDATISVQNPIILDDGTEPEPDIALLKPRDDVYASGHPRPDDVLLIVEVADTSVDDDRIVKLPRYSGGVACEHSRPED